MSVIHLLNKNGEEITNRQVYCDEPDCLGEQRCSTWGICNDKAKNLAIHQVTSEMNPKNFSEVDQLIMEVKTTEESN